MANQVTLDWLAARGLAQRVVAALAEVADRASGAGVNVLVFGSFATGTNRPNSDLDLGVLAPAGTESVVRQLRADLADLPTIRPIDAVDLNTASETFRRMALADARPL